MGLNNSKLLFATKNRNLITYTDPESLISEQFRTIRTNISFIMGKEKGRNILITSPSKQDGKSTTAANIAVSMVQQKEKILLIDGNLREPNIHNIFKASNETGLTDILTGKSTFEDAVYPTNIGSLDILTSGSIPSNPVELLASYPMKQLLQKLNSIYDMIIVDSPAVLEVTDTKIIANLCDGVILVVRQDKTKNDRVFEAKKVLDYARAQIIGVILNKKIY